MPEWLKLAIAKKQKKLEKKKEKEILKQRDGTEALHPHKSHISIQPGQSSC